MSFTPIGRETKLSAVFDHDHFDLPSPQKIQEKQDSVTGYCRGPIYSLLSNSPPSTIEELCSSFEEPFRDPSMEPRPLAPTFASEIDPGRLSKLIGFALDGASNRDCDDTASIASLSDISMASFGGHNKRHAEKATPNDAPLSNQLQPSTHEDETVSRFRPHQDVLWCQQFQKLLRYKEENGHCCVPITFSQDPMLARWIKRQRYQYKRFHENKPSAINFRRITLLESTGFIWNAHSVQWQEKWNELAAYVLEHGHCSVPSYDPDYVQLSTWVKCQRRQYQLLQSGKLSNMTENRVEKLESLGFVWKLRHKSQHARRTAWSEE